MLTLFPQLLFLAPAGTALLRITAGLVFVYWAYVYWTRHEEIAKEAWPMVGTVSPWLVVFGAFVSAVIGVLLLVGLWTQLAALIAALGAIKAATLSKSHPNSFPFSRSGNLLLLVICLSLIVSGAGSFALDLPL